MVAFVATASAGIVPVHYASEPITQYSSIPASTVITNAVGPATYAVRSALPIAHHHHETIVPAYHHAAAVEVRSAAPLVHSAPYFRSVYDSVPTVYAAAPAVQYVQHATPIVEHHAPAVVEVRAAPTVSTVIAGEAKYTAANLGAVHEAPLPGHALSQTSLNLAPAA